MYNNKYVALTERIVRDLEDLRQSQRAIVQKLAKIEVLNLMLGDERLEREAPNMHDRLADSILDISVALEELSRKKEAEVMQV